MRFDIKKTFKISILFGLVVMFLICGYFLRLDRFGFTNIHWMDFIQYKHRLYTVVTDNDGTPLTVNNSEIGNKIGEVQYTLQGNVRNTSYIYRNLDASTLEKGTPIYQMKGNNYTNKLAIYLDGLYYLYQVSY